MHRRSWLRTLAPSVAPLLVALAGSGVTGCAPGASSAESSGAARPDAGEAGADAAPDQLIGQFDAGLEGGAVACTDTTDGDGDFIADAIEEKDFGTDTDGDGTADYQDLDSDDDGWPDAVEAVNPTLPDGAYGQVRPTTCSQVADSDGDGTPDFRDLDADDDSIPDADEKAYDADGSKNCRVLPDCDHDGYDDVVEIAAKSKPDDATSVPPKGTLFFTLPYGVAQQKDFDFAAGLSDADIYFLVDTTASMQATIDGVASSLDSTIIPSILNGDPTAKPPIPAIPNARIGIGDFRDVPWAPYGAPDDDVYRTQYEIGNQLVSGEMADPKKNGSTYGAPDTVKQILGQLHAGGGGDSPESTTQALWMAATGQEYSVYKGGGPWHYPGATCPAGTVGAPCFRSTSLPIFVLITDAPFHAGSNPLIDYAEGDDVAGTQTYADTVSALNAINAKIVGVPVNTGSPGAARADLIDLATQTDSTWDDDAFGGTTRPLVTAQDTSTGDVSKEVVQLVGKLAGQGLRNVTTAKSNYSCPGNVDCDGDGAVDPKYDNPILAPETTPFDASRLIKTVEPVASSSIPLPYKGIDATTFYGVKGEATVTFRVHAKNDVIKPASLIVVRAELRVQTPKGIVLGGAKGVKVVYFILPRYLGDLH